MGEFTTTGYEPAWKSLRGISRLVRSMCRPTHLKTDQRAHDQTDQLTAVQALTHSRLIQLPDPDIPKADRRARIAVRLELDRCRAVCGVLRRADVRGVPLQLVVVLHQRAVV